MAIDMGEVLARPDAPRPAGWRPRSVIASILAALLLAGAIVAYVARSTPQVVPGSVIAAGHGVKELSDGVDVTRWEQTAGHSWVAWTVRNDGASTVTLTSLGDWNPLPNAMPRLESGFLPNPLPYGGTPPQLEAAGAKVSDLQRSISVEPGQEVYVVAEVFYPDECFFGGTNTAAGPRYSLGSVPVDARVLGRTTSLALPLPYPVDTPTRAGTCDEAFFAGSVAARAPRHSASPVRGTSAVRGCAALTG